MIAESHLFHFFINLFYFLLVNVGEDCPVFDGLYEFCQLSTGGSLGMYIILAISFSTQEMVWSSG